MASVQTLIDAIIDAPPGTKFEVTVAGRNEYETIRTALVKKWVHHREMLSAIADDDPTTNLSLCGDYADCEDVGVATFYLGKSRRKQARSFEFTIVNPSS